MNRMPHTCFALHRAHKFVVLLVMLTALALFGARTAHALGTAAGIDIQNTATVDYTLGGINLSTTSNTASTRIAELLDVNVTWQDAASVTVSPAASNQVLSFLLTNTGNGTDSYNLAIDNTLGGDQFDPQLVSIYLDANANSVYDAGVDTLYLAGVNNPLLAADAALSVFVVNNIPAMLNDGDLGNSLLRATSTTGSGTPGAVIAAAGEGGTDAVVGSSGGRDNATGSYVVNSFGVALVKSVVISDPLGGNQPMPGATLSYSIAVTVTGTGTATAVLITDSIPVNTTYVAGSLLLNGTPLSDAVDADAGDVGGSTPNTVSVNLGDLDATSPVHTIMFNVIIN